MSTDQQPLLAVSHHGWSMALPAGWVPVEPDMFETALAQAEAAFTGGGRGAEHAVEHLRAYYDPAGRYAGATFLDVEGYDDFAVTAADLWAVTTLSMTVPPDAGRALLYPGALRNIVNRNLRLLPPTLPLSDAAPVHLDHMWNLYDAIRTMLPALGEGDTHQWVMASKLCARKRPLLFPVRDSQVCRYVANTHLMGEQARTARLVRTRHPSLRLPVHPRGRTRLDQERPRPRPGRAPRMDRRLVRPTASRHRPVDASLPHLRFRSDGQRSM